MYGKVVFLATSGDVANLKVVTWPRCPNWTLGRSMPMHILTVILSGEQKFTFSQLFYQVSNNAHSHSYFIR